MSKLINYKLCGVAAEIYGQGPSVALVADSIAEPVDRTPAEVEVAAVPSPVFTAATKIEEMGVPQPEPIPQPELLEPVVPIEIAKTEDIPQLTVVLPQHVVPAPHSSPRAQAAVHLVWMSPIVLMIGLVAIPGFRHQMPASEIVELVSQSISHAMPALKPDEVFQPAVAPHNAGPPELSQSSTKEWLGEPIQLRPRPSSYVQIVRH